MKNLSLSFIHHIRKITEESIKSEEVRHQLKRCLLDWTGVTYAGAYEVGDKFESLLEIAGEGVCSTFLTNQRKDLVSAASINGYLSHVMELDDGHRFGMLHLEAPIISAMIAVAQKEKIGYIQFAKGVIAGYQAIVQIARYLQPYHKQKGYHATGTCGALGVATAIAVALDFTDEEFENALGAASTRAAGLLSVIDAPSEMKPFNVAGAVESGVRAAYLAKTGIQGPIDPLLGKRGFLRVYSPESGVKEDLIFTDVPEILQIYFKPYVSCRHCHAPAEAALNLRSRYGIKPTDVKNVQVETYLLAIGGHDNIEINSVSAAKMSTPYCVAVSLQNGSCGLNSFSKESIKNEEIQKLVRKVSVIEDPNLTQVSPGKRGAKVTISLNDGLEYTDFVENPLGEPEHPMSDSMLENKYFELMKYAGVDDKKTEILKEMIWELENKFDVFLSEI